jgi:Zn-dependent peptidase ImmA (M78 family)/DNA-binding XRE family transcriptional regulator
MLALARESRGYTQTQLAAKIGISQAEISKFENGLKIPSEDQVGRIAGRLGYTTDFFYLDEAIRAFGSGCVYHRKRKSATETKLTQLLAVINVKRIQVKQLLKSVEARPAYSFPRLDLDEFKDGPAEVARALRSLWQLPPGPIVNLVRAIEDAGGIVIREDFGTSKVDALSQWLPGQKSPVFLVNKAIPTDRMRFTLAHELGHICMHAIITDNMEREADRFAGEFLMPERDIRPFLSPLDIPRLAALKPHWRVAMSALLYRAAELKTIDDKRKSYLWFRMGQAGYRTHEPIEIPPEEPTLLKELMWFHERSLGYKREEIDITVYEPGAFSDHRPESVSKSLRLV